MSVQSIIALTRVFTRYNESMSDFFMKYQTGPNAGQIYNEPIPCGDQYFWNFTNPGT